MNSFHDRLVPPDVENEGIPHCLLSLLAVISVHQRPIPSSKLNDRYERSPGGIFVPSRAVSFAYIPFND